MNRRSFLKVVGVSGAGAMATFSLTSVGMSAIKKFSGNADTAAAQKVMKGIEDYGSSDLVSRVATSNVEKAILLGINSHTDNSLPMLRIDAQSFIIDGRAYHDCLGLNLRNRYLPVTFKFGVDPERIVNDFDYMMWVTGGVSKSVMSYKHHLIADPHMAELVSAQTGQTILPVF